MLVEKIYYSYKNTIIGSLAGGIGGYYFAKKYIKENKTWILVASVILGATIGSVTENRIRAKVASIKSKNLIEK